MEAKPWYLSVTIWGIIVGAVGLVLGFFGIQIDTTLQNTIVSTIVDIIPRVLELIGIAMTLIGRVKATKQIVATGTKAKAINATLVS